MKKYSVFYAWQSDTEQNYDRRLIGKALDMAAEAISTDPSVAAQVIIDSDTQGVAGATCKRRTIAENIRVGIFRA